MQKKQVLIVSNDRTLRSILRLNILNACPHVDISFADNGALAAELIKETSNIDLIICYDLILRENTFLIVDSTLAAFKRDLMLIGVGNNRIKHLRSVVIDPREEWTKTLSAALEFLKSNEDFGINSQGNGYAPLEITLFRQSPFPLCGDLFLKGQKQGGFIKCYSTNEVLDKDEIDRFVWSGLTFFYVRQSDLILFIHVLTQGYSKLLLEGAFKSPLEASALIYDLLARRVELLNVDANTLALAELGIKNMRLAVEKSESISRLLLRYKANEISFAYIHSHLCCLFMYKILPSYDLAGKAIKEKVLYFCYFNDLSLGLNEKYIKIRNEKGLNNFSFLERSLIKNHAKVSAEYLENIPDIPVGTIELILEHHGSKVGIGFPNSIAAGNISQIASIFMIVEEFCLKLLSISHLPVKKDIEEVLTTMENEVSKSSSQRIIATLRDVILKK